MFPCDTGEGEIKASVAAVRFIFMNATRFDVAANILARELQQLGLPKGKQNSIGKKKLPAGIGKPNTEQ
jgi:hypothetical protein